MSMGPAQSRLGEMSAESRSQPPFSNESMSSSSSQQPQRRPETSSTPSRRRQRQVSGVGFGGGGKKLSRRLSRRLSGIFSRQDSVMNKAARRDSLSDIYDKVSRGEASYVRGIDHPLIKSLVEMDNDEQGYCVYDEDARETMANVKTPRAA